MKIDIEKPTIDQKDIITILEGLIKENISPLQKELVIEDYSDRSIIIVTGTIYNGTIKSLTNIIGISIFFDNGIVIVKN